MPLMEWDESFSVKVHLIDRQHQRLFEYANRYYEALKTGKSKMALSQLLDRLSEYIAIHFSTEERYFTQFNYSETEEHKYEHKILSAKVNDLKSKIKVNVDVDKDEVTHFLKIWLEKHIKETDHKYIDCFRNNGLR